MTSRTARTYRRSGAFGPLWAAPVRFPGALVAPVTEHLDRAPHFTPLRPTVFSGASAGHVYVACVVASVTEDVCDVPPLQGHAAAGVWRNTAVARLGGHPGSLGQRLVAPLEKVIRSPTADIAAELVEESPLAWTPSLVTEASLVRRVVRSWTKTSLVEPASVSPTSVRARLWNEMWRPSAEMDGTQAASSACCPSLETDTRVVSPVARSWRKTSPMSLVSPGTRLVAELRKATKRPSAEIAGSHADRLAWAPSEATDTRSVRPVARSRTKTSTSPFVSPGTSVGALLLKTIVFPSAEMTAPVEWDPWGAGTPPLSTDTGTVVPPAGGGGGGPPGPPPP